MNYLVVNRLEVVVVVDLVVVDLVVVVLVVVYLVVVDPEEVVLELWSGYEERELICMHLLYKFLNLLKTY